jgi:hypothetical protein
MDRRLEIRGNRILEAIDRKKSAIANRYCRDATEEKGNRRFMSNPRIENKQLKQASYTFCQERAQGKTVLAIQDTTEINYQKHAGRLSLDDPELGPVGNNRDIGFFLHPMLVVDVETCFPLGFASIHDWNRDWNKGSKEERHYKKQAIEEKESYRWVSSAQQTKSQLKEARHITVIGDRESDIYEELVEVPDEHCDLLIRSARNRNLYDREENLFEHLASLPSQGEMTIEIQGNRNRAKRRAELEIRYTSVKIARPLSRAASNLPTYVEINAIEIREKKRSVPKGEAPILWRLLTTHEIKGLEDAKTYARWYSYRWWIEELFRVLKRQGLNVEDAQYENGLALKRLALMALQVALQIMQLVAAREGKYEITPESVFEKDALTYQEKLLPHLEGKTTKQKNPYPRSNLAWSAWIIARLGGWKGSYAKGKLPGPITMKRGLEIFVQQFIGWQMALSSVP